MWGIIVEWHKGRGGCRVEDLGFLGRIYSLGFQNGSRMTTRESGGETYPPPQRSTFQAVEQNASRCICA